MSKQYNKALKQQRRKKYLKRKRIAAKGKKPATAVAAPAAQAVSVESSGSPAHAAVAASPA